MANGRAVDDVMPDTADQYARYVELAQLGHFAGSVDEPEFSAPAPAPLGLVFGKC